MAIELNAGLSFLSLKDKEQRSFKPSPIPVLTKVESGLYLYKWTGYKLELNRDGHLTQFWLPWTGFKAGNFEVPGFKELRMRYRNRDGSVGRPQEFARARNAVTHQWNEMSSILMVQLREAVWGYVGVTASQRFFEDEKHPTELENVAWIGGDYQLCIPNLTFDYLQKV